MNLFKIAFGLFLFGAAFPLSAHASQSECTSFSWSVAMMPERMENQSAVTDFLKTIGSDKIQAPLLRLVTGGQISFIIRVNPEFDPAAIDTLKANTLDTIKKLESMKGVYVECNYPPRLIE